LTFRFAKCPSDENCFAFVAVWALQIRHPADVFHVVCDVHEQRSGIPQLLRERGIDAEVCRLGAGDYLTGPDALVERKTVPDLHATVIRGRFWRQISALRDSGGWSCLLIEGSSVYDGPLSESSIRGIWLTLADLGVIVVRSSGPVDTANWLIHIARRRHESTSSPRAPYRRRRTRDTSVPPAQQALAATPGISLVTAGKLLDRFGSVQQVASASEEDLRSVRGIGERRARAIAAVVRDSAQRNLTPPPHAT
jgi:DNA excision repair protein ERCC-4